MSKLLNTVLNKAVVASLLASTCMASSAIAQSEEEFKLEEVLVTAQKRTQSVQDIGIAVTALTGDELRDQNITNTKTLTDAVPNMALYDSSGGVPVVIVRGVGLQNFRVNDTPTTSFYIDEVYQTSIAMATFTMFDLDRVEILKGPQGGLYGRNALGGAVQVISAKPSLEEKSGYAKAGYGKYQRLELEGAVGGPISDKVAVRVAGRMVNSDDTYYHSTTGNFDHGEEDIWALRGQALFAPSEKSEILFKVHGGKDQSDTPLLRAVRAWRRFGMNIFPSFADGALFNYAGVNPGLGSLCDAILNGGRDANSCETLDGRTEAENGILGKYDSASNSRPGLDNKWWGTSLNMRFFLDDYTLTSITAFDHFKHARMVDLDAVDTVQQHIDYRSNIKVWSQEVRLARDLERSRWMIGANFGKDTLIENTFLEGLRGLVPLAFGGLTQGDQPYKQKTKMWSAFGHFDFNLSDLNSLVIEARYTKEYKDFVGGVNLPQANIPLSYADDKSNYSALSGKIGIERRQTEDLLLYANISRGFKSGGFFGGFATNNAQLEPFDKETILSYEVGFKSELANNRLRLNGALFYYDRTDIQASATDPTATVPIKQLTNVGDGRNYGAELEMTWLLSQNFQLRGGVGYVNSKITDSDLLVGDIYAVGQFSPEGARLPNTPEFSANLMAVYERSMSDNLLGHFQVEYSYRSNYDMSMVTLKEEKAVLTEDGYSLVNLRAGIRNEETGWQFDVYIENLLDKQYRTVARPDGLAGIYDVYAAPRIWGVSATYAF